MRFIFPEQRWIKNWLIDHRMTQRKLADCLGIDESGCSRILSGERPITMALAIQLAQVMGITVDEVVANAGISEVIAPPRGADAVLERLQRAVEEARAEIRTLGYVITCEVSRSV